MAGEWLAIIYLVGTIGMLFKTVEQTCLLCRGLPVSTGWLIAIVIWWVANGVLLYYCNKDMDDDF